MTDWTRVPLGTHIGEENSVTDKLRQAVLYRDNHQCQRCGSADLDALNLHHVIYRSLLGKHSMDNLITLCGNCHKSLHAGRTKIIRVDGTWYFKHPSLKHLNGLRKRAMDNIKDNL